MKSLYKTSTKVIQLLKDLIEEGYPACGMVVNHASYYSGQESYLENVLYISLEYGFCKENLVLVEDSDGIILAIGRYGLNKRNIKSVKDIVECAWDSYLCYKDSGYSVPDEFISLFEKYGYIKKSTQEVYEEIK